MRKPSVRGPSAALTEARHERDDPVVAIGVKIAAVIAALERNENKPDVTERDRLALCDYLAALEAAAMSQPATTLAGCMLQVALMNQMFNNGSPDPSYSDYNNKEAARRFEMAVYSVIDVLYRECGREPKTLGCDYYAGAQKGLALKFRWLMDGVGEPDVAKRRA
jgi:hypothetical protein